MTKARVSEAEAKFDAARRRIGLVLAPLVFFGLLFAPLSGISDQAHSLAAITAMTVILWVTEAIPLPAAALLGPALAAVFGVTSPKEALAAFADPLIFLFMGGFMLAAALSRHRFDRRAALWLIARPIVSGSPARALIAIVVISFMFSMWISNTATTAMLIPVALGLHGTMLAVLPDDDATIDKLHRFSGGMCLALAYASSLGGSATPIGTGPNVIAVGMLEAKTGSRIDFLQWMSFGLPTAIAMTVLVVIGALRMFPAPVKRVEGLMAEVRRQLGELGPTQAAEFRTLGVFGLAVSGWLTPSFAKLFLGPTHPFSVWTKSHLSEGVVALVCACLLFFVPAGGAKGKDGERLLDWEDAQRMDWGTLFLLGGGLALGRMTFETGLAEAVGRGILDASGPIAQSQLGLTAAAVLLVVFLTEVTSNTATTSMMLPVLIGIAQVRGFDATATAVAVTLAASYAFMLPVSTPPNAMAYGTQMIRLDAMVRFGFRLDLLGFAVLMAAVVGILPLVL